jgi:hypothetical protein
VYTSINLVVRRKPKENNFKAILETIRDLMNTKTVVPEWLHDTFLGMDPASFFNLLCTCVFVPDRMFAVGGNRNPNRTLGYGDPASAQPKQTSVTFDYVDTFLSREHLLTSFAGKQIRFTTENQEGPYRITFPAEDPQKYDPMRVEFVLFVAICVCICECMCDCGCGCEKCRFFLVFFFFTYVFACTGASCYLTVVRRGRDVMDQDQVITVEHYDVPNQGPYPRDIPKKNTIPFTPVQSTLTVCHQEKEKFRV